MPKLSYAQIAQKSKETSADNANSDRCGSDYDDVQTAVKDVTQSSSNAAMEPRPPRGVAPTSVDPRPTHSHSHNRPPRGGSGGTHMAAADEMRHRDYNGIASAARPLP